MADPPKFRADLYRGTAPFYDRYRLSYPAVLLDDLASRAGLTGSGRLLDLGCGTGQVTFGLCQRFASVWAIDLEAESVAFARAKAERIGATNIEWMSGRAEDFGRIELDEPDQHLEPGRHPGQDQHLGTGEQDEREGHHEQHQLLGQFELVTAGNAFHRFDRHRVAAAAWTWLKPGGHLALLWNSSTWNGGAGWQQVMGEVVERWTDVAGARARIPDGWDRGRVIEPDAVVLDAAGFEIVGTFHFPTPHRWSVDELVGLMYSTSFLSLAALGDHAAGFEADLRERLLAVHPDGVFAEDVDFAYQLARRP